MNSVEKVAFFHLLSIENATDQKSFGAPILKYNALSVVRDGIISALFKMDRIPTYSC